MSRDDEVATLLEEMADHLEARGVDYKHKSYRRAADSIRAHAVAVETLPAEVLLGLLDPLALARRHRVAALYLEDERPEVDRRPLDLDALGDVDAERRALTADALEQLLSLVLLHDRR